MPDISFICNKKYILVLNIRLYLTVQTIKRMCKDTMLNLYMGVIYFCYW